MFIKIFYFTLKFIKFLLKFLGKFLLKFYKNKIFIFLIKKKLILRKIKIDKMDENFEEQ